MAEILVLEDDQETRELSEKMLEMKTGEDAEAVASVEEVEDFDYAVVVSDYEGIDTAEVYERAEQLILFSGYSESSLEVPESAEYVQKGAGYEELVGAVEEKLRN